MYPSFEVFGFDIHLYSIFYMLGLTAGGFVFVCGRKKFKDQREKLFDLYIYMVLGIMLGAKLMYILVNIKDYIGNISMLWYDLRRGFLFYGGFIGACVAAFLFFRKNKDLPYLEVIDLAAPAIPLGHAIGRIGCICAGCCYGKPTNLPWGIVYPETCPIAPSGIPLHPTPIYELLLNLVLFAILMKVRDKTKYKGVLISYYLVGYGIIRFFNEFFRADYDPVFLNLTVAQWTSIAMFVCAVIYFFIVKAANNKMDLSKNA